MDVGSSNLAGLVRLAAQVIGRPIIPWNSVDYLLEQHFRELFTPLRR
jgi:hypothetical protein